MLTVEIELETVTPLFLSGADQSIAELRAPAFRGALRYWLRALLGVGQDAEAVYEAESRVFGNTSQGSAVALRLRGQTSSQNWYPPRAQAGIQYLLFSIRQRDPQTRQDVIRPSIPAGTTFSLIIQQRANPNDPTPMEQTLNALWLLCNLGGLGARSRRGLGSLAVRSVVSGNRLNECVERLQQSARTPQELAANLQNGFQAMRHDLRSVGDGDLPEFDILHPDHCRIIVVKRTWRRWEDTMEALGQHFKAFRSNMDDRRKVGNALQHRGDGLETIKRAAFGLPIVFFYRGIGQSSLEGEEHDRRASPLHFHITKLANGTYTIVLTCFKARLLAPATEKKQAEQLKLPSLDRRTVIEIPPPDLTILDEFLDQLNSKSNNVPLGEPLEVTL